ncbi:MAG: hypothetical protein QM478_08270 [Flavobacteriaceae bacterium]
MKNIKLLFVFTIITTILLACSSSFEIADKWKTDNFSSLKGEKVLVLYKTENTVTKQRFEKDLANELRAVGVDATEGHIAFPEWLRYKEARTEAEIAEVIKVITDAGYKGVVLTVLKDQAQQTESTTTGGYTTGGYGGYGGYYGGGYYGGGFGSYYGGMRGYGYGYGGGSMYVPQETTTRVVDVYLFETVIYNLDLPDNEELVGVVSVKLTDPESYSKVAAKYTKAVAAEFTNEVK